MNNKHNLEINDLIDNAVNNALERRNEALEALADVSDEEMKNVSGGFTLTTSGARILTTYGVIFNPRTTIGYVEQDSPNTYTPNVTVLS
ncbi:hypothetical protein [Nodularia spumigena]|uniref:Nif11 domain-containing protein n=1 Tax=Nodularia spumigena UHCC 0060 TaxID=3110300 RepID=A0ABU5UUI1_NODSP|nr:hypothetical protein [Nodularia spumigena]MEA5526897.1 hypothetical protein [Nodularia spumigena UHCC 0143]MEA5609911.1 hypothetical protein [Nodularia spumigena UHCC 0060]MEA5613096.1 hypothetical protein [Nodularia spumigena UHCC 0040]